MTRHQPGRRRARSPHLLASAVIAALPLAAALPAASAHAQTGQAQTTGTGSLSGRVVHRDTGSLLEGATVRLVELQRETTVGREGLFSFAQVPAGEYTLRVSYVGAAPAVLAVEVGPGATQRVDVALSASYQTLDSVVVTARSEGQGETLSLQRTAPTYRTVVSADALGQIREGNIGDALVRLPAVSVETRAGVQRTATIRGLAPQYNTVTVDGLRMTNVDGNRDIALDSFPSNMLARVDVIKATTPNLPADAIGGTVNLITRTAFDQEGPVLEGEIGGTYNDVRGNWNRQATVTIGDRFGADDRFGVLASLAYFHDRRGYDVANTAYTVGADDRYLINRTLYYDRYEVKDKYGAGLALDFRPHNGARYFFKGLYNYDYRDLNHYGTDWRPNPAEIVSEQGDVVATGNGRVDAFSFYREPKNVFQMYILGGEHYVDGWQIDYRGAWSRAKKDYPETIQLVTSFNGVDLTYDRSNPDFPAFTVTNGVDVHDPAGLAFRQAQRNQVPRVEDEISYDVNVGRDLFAWDTPIRWSGGARVTLKDASQAQPDTVRYTGLQGIPAAALLEYVDTPGFLGAGRGNAVLLGFYPDWRGYMELINGGSDALTRNAAARLYTDETRANADFDISEDIYGAYTQAEFDLGPLQLLAGVRFEQTRLASRANEVVIEDGEVVSVAPVHASNSYNNVLPGLHARYGIGEQFQLRGSITSALSRPPPGDLIPSRQENAQMNQRIIGNPELEPAESLNVDLAAEYYFSSLGILSAALFYKDIDNFVFSASRIAEDGVDERTRVNGDGGKVRGLELVWAQQFTFLPGHWSGLGIEANYTRLDSEGSYPGREGEDLGFVNSPNYILNLIGSYDRGPFSLRVSYNRLPDRLESVGGRAALDTYNAAVSVWDLAARYRLTPGVELFLNVKNIGDEPTVQYQGNRGNPTLITYYGTQYNFGLKLNF